MPKKGEVIAEYQQGIGFADRQGLTRKKCKKCGQLKRIELFSYCVDPQGVRQRRGTCRRCRHLHRKYKTTQKIVDRLQEKYRGRCPICKRKRRLLVDHDHNTGDVRGLLCNGCNSWLGWYDNHREAVDEYLKE